MKAISKSSKKASQCGYLSKEKENNAKQVTPPTSKQNTIDVSENKNRQASNINSIEIASSAFNFQSF